MGGFRRYPVKCTLCKEETALVGENINKKFTVEFFERNGWVFSKYKTMCPRCAKKEKERFEQMKINDDNKEA